MINEGKFLSREIATLHSSQTEINAPEVVQQEPPWPQEHSWPEHTEFSYQDPSSKEAVFNNHHTHQTQHWPYEQYAAQPYGASSSSLPAQSSYTPVGFSEGPPEQRRNADILGLARSTFILLVLLGVVIIVAAVGGGVGGSIAVQ